MRVQDISAGKSINLALSHRGIESLLEVGLTRDQIDSIVLPMKSRCIHKDGELHHQSYSHDNALHINSVGREHLNSLLLDLADDLGIPIHFNSKIQHVDAREKYIISRGRIIRFEQLFGADGAFSSTRKSMVNMPYFNLSQQYSDHAYKEISIPPTESGEHKIENNCLHIWPKGTYMLIALPNLDGSFTVTLFCPKNIFDEINTEEKVLEFFNINFPDVVPIADNLVEEFLQNPIGSLCTVKCSPWNNGNATLILGDAAHAIVPFFGQGMNCGLEDVTKLFKVIEEIGLDEGWGPIFEQFSAQRKVDTDCIANMSHDNYIEMCNRVADDHYVWRKQITAILCKQFPTKFLPRYECVSFTSLPYSEAEKRAVINENILDELTKDLVVGDLGIDLQLAQELIDQNLKELDVDRS
eukprot:TRINITY_DN3820_c0_g1_i1.p1 TRINITY_DN3820_c0_g1~~TRINITY_DN3820_c0_g1_i1.p1  ORF type:complete len:412 (-),score=79.88 TRINITY_DN3820_c0_g1_i1:96-1331(-)